MICIACGTELDISTKFCPECGAAVAKASVPSAIGIPSLRTSRSSDVKKTIGWLLLAAAVLVIVLIVKGTASSHKTITQSGLETSPLENTTSNDMTSSPPEATIPQAPVFSGLSLHPYDLQKNPYQAKGKLVTLILNTMPVLYNGAVIQYSGPIDPTFGTRMGLMALRLDRMADEHTALYSIMGTEAGSSGGETLGQIAVELPDGKTDLKLDRAWMVEPVEPLQGTNYLGAEIQIPAVRFWRYVGENDGSETNQEATVAASSGFHYTKYPNGYMVDELCSTKMQGFCYPQNWQQWIVDLEMKTVGEQTDALNADTGAASPGNLVISWDSEQRVVFSGFRPHDSTSASAYFIVAPTKRELDIIWQRGNELTYLGPNAVMLRNAHAYEWLHNIGT
jgi:hypothetical protein